jgi:hypothetical protein
MHVFYFMERWFILFTDFIGGGVYRYPAIEEITIPHGQKVLETLEEMCT